MPKSEVHNMDCIEFMRSLPDKSFDLAVVDPPFGGGNDESMDGKKREVGGGWFSKYKDISGGKRFGERFDRYKCDKADFSWDVAPPKEYFDELFRVSKNQIIFGANYFANMPPARCFIVWRKLTISETFTMAMAEYAWTSFKDNAKVFEYPPQRDKDDLAIHPTQKPIALYQWIFKNYAKPGDTILDTHLGSGSSRIAAWYAGLDFTACEIDEYYYEMQEKRFQMKVNGITEKNGHTVIEQKLF